MPLDWPVVFSGLVGAVIGGTVTAGVHLWKLRRDEFGARCDELCKAILDASEKAAEYWSQQFTPTDEPKGRILEARLLGMQALIDGLTSQVINRFIVEDKAAIQDALSDLFDGLTGGEFSTAGRSVDRFRTSKASQVSGGLIPLIRAAHRRTLPFRLGR